MEQALCQGQHFLHQLLAGLAAVSGNYDRKMLPEGQQVTQTLADMRVGIVSHEMKLTEELFE